MEPMPKAAKILPTLALLLALAPTAFMLALIACSAGGNWGFLILGGLTYLVSEVLCGSASLTLGILCIRKRWGRGRAIIAVVLSAPGLLTTFELVGSFLVIGIF